MDRKRVFVITVIFGAILGFSSAYLNFSQPNQCDSIEQQIKQNQKFNGSLACYPPGVLEVNISDQLEEKAELQCVCRKINNGNIQLFPILSTGQDEVKENNSLR